MNRFDVLDDMVLDNTTGLVWTRNASLSDFPMTWNEAFAFVEDLNQSGLYGYKDWKLPERKELFSLISHETVNPCLPPGHPFVNVFTGYYWTATSCARLPEQAWYIHLGGARVFKGMKHGSYMMWPVRSAQNRDGRPGAAEGEAHRFTAGRHDVADHATGLIWMKDADIARTAMDWKTAFAFVAQLNREAKFGFSDWRVPTIAELESLVDPGRHSPALPAGHLFAEVKDFYWSSTTSMYDPAYAWTLYLRDGAVGVGYKPLTEFHLWPVRGERANFSVHTGDDS